MSATNTVLLRGLQPQPLASYLAALGVLRICATLDNALVRGAFSRAGFLLEGIVEPELLELLLDAWKPTPVLTPWNNASGFYDSSKGRIAAEAMRLVVASQAPRLTAFIHAIEQVRRIIAAAGYLEAPEKQEKAAFLALLRSVLPDDCVAWLDAVAVVDEGEVRMMPVLGSGGNEGVLDYSGLYLRSLVDTVLGERSRSKRLLQSALFATPTTDLLGRPGGQFDPGTAGGFNTGPDFESKELPNNPWMFLLLIEGSLLWASGMASRQRGIDSGYRFAVSPFTVRHRAAGYGSAGSGDDDPQRVRAEVWVPVWQRPAGLAEVARLIAEGRVEVSGRKRNMNRATDSMDFADAVASLGVDRGIDRFVRYAFIKRRGESYIALPAGLIDVHYRREVDLLRQLDGELEIVDRFLARFPSEQGPPAQLIGLRRAIDEARFDVAMRGGPDAMTRLVRSMGALEMTLARRDPAKDPQLYRPLGGLGHEWVEACGDNVEVRIAAALAAIAPTGGAGPMRAYLAPLDRKDPDRYAPASRPLTWAGVDLADRLGNVLQRRLLDVSNQANGAKTRSQSPTWGIRRASLDDVAAFLDPEAVDDRAIEELLFGFTWVRSPGTEISRKFPAANGPLPRGYSLLKLLFLPGGISRAGEEPVHLVPEPAIVSLLRAGRVTDAVALACRQLRAKGLLPRRVVDDGIVDPAWGRRLAAALLIPVMQIRPLVDHALLPPTDNEKQEMADAR